MANSQSPGTGTRARALRPASSPDAPVLGRWSPTRAADVTAGRRQLGAALHDGARPAGAAEGGVERLLLAFDVAPLTQLAESVESLLLGEPMTFHEDAHRHADLPAGDQRLLQVLGVDGAAARSPRAVANCSAVSPAVTSGPTAPSWRAG